MSEHVEVLIVGAGLSGIGAAARLERDRPGTEYAILEARERIGGTWDLFRYPGVRSDTDMYTFSYPFRPWTGTNTMGSAEEIRDYIRDTAAEYGIERHIRFGTRVLGAAWSSDDALWTVTTDRGEWTCSFLYLCAGYYDYARGHQPEFPGVADHRGTLVHPQFWPEDLDVGGRDVVVIGSGATAVTLVPALARTARHVTMLQRSPSYVMALPSADAVADRLRRWLPAGLAHRVVRAKNAALTQGVYLFSRARPTRARAFFRRQALSFLDDPDYVDTHFRPSYNPWEQRLTIAPEGDLYRVLRDGTASVVTDHVETFTPDGIRLRSGRELRADVVVTATGLEIVPLGGLELVVDGEPVDVADTTAYRAVMLSGIPNLAFCFGYTNNSWMLRADLSSRWVVRLLRHMDAHGYTSATPRAEAVGQRRPFIADLTAGYIQRAVHRFPAQGGRGPWRVRQNYLLDALTAVRADVTRHMEFGRRTPRAAVHGGRRIG